MFFVQCQLVLLKVSVLGGDLVFVGLLFARKKLQWLLDELQLLRCSVRILLSSIKQKEVDEQITADDAVSQQIIAKLIKQRKDSVEQYLAGNRKDLADKESAEIKTFEVYLPAQLSDEEIQKIVDEVVTSAGLSGPAAMGKAMGTIKPKVAGKADMGRVSALLRARQGR